MIFGTASDEVLGDQLRVTVIATGLNSGRSGSGHTAAAGGAASAPAAEVDALASNGMDEIETSALLRKPAD